MFEMKLKLIFFICVWTSTRAKEIPNCDYFDTVDLTYSEKLPNGSYIYEGVVIPPEQTGTYSYKILIEGTKTIVEDHWRGCVCKLKPCIRYCCHRHRLDLDDESKCTKEFNDYSLYRITLENGTIQGRRIRDQFVVQPGIRIHCSMDIIKPYLPNRDWKLFENGTLYRSIDNVYLSKRDYCLQPKEFYNYNWNFMLLPMNCLPNFDYDELFRTHLVFLLLTILIYIFVIKLKHAYDKCCLCYLICFLTVQLTDMLIFFEHFLEGTTCYIAAYLQYFLTISVYLWLAVMGFEFFRIFVVDMFVTIQYNNQSRFLKYSLFVWGTASSSLLITILADFLLDNLDIDSNWKVGYAYYTCGLKEFDWSNFVYLFGPTTLMALIKITFMIATIWHVHIKNRKNRKQLEELGQHNIKNNMMFSFYFRILITEILNWLIELCVIFYNNIIGLSSRETIANIGSLLAPAYCICFFAIAVTRRDVLQLLNLRKLRGQRIAG